MANDNAKANRDIRVGDTVSLGDFPYSTATVVKVYLTPQCGTRIDTVRPYVIMDGDGVTGPYTPQFGHEEVNFVSPANVEIVRRVPRA